MKKISVAFGAICCATACLCSGCFGIFEKKVDHPIPSLVEGESDLFSPAVLEYYEIPWLQKPDNVSHETAKIEYSWYSFRARIVSEEAYLHYVQTVFDKLVNGNYTIGYFVTSGSDGELWTSISYYIYSTSNNLQDYFAHLSDENYLFFELFYTVIPPEAYDESHDAYPLKEVRNLNINLTRTANETGLYDFSISLGISGHEIDYLRFDEDTSERLNQSYVLQ